MRCLIALSCTLFACQPADRADRPAAARAYLDPEASPQVAAQARFCEQDGPGCVDYLGLSVQPRSPKPGDELDLRHVFQIVHPFESQPKVFVHIDQPRGRRVAIGDHRPIQGLLSFKDMKEGERWVDAHRLTLPEGALGPSLNIWVGLYTEQSRIHLEAKASDGQHRLRAMNLKVQVPPLPVAQIHIRTSTIHLDGLLDETAWKKAEVLELSDSLGRSTSPRYPTKLRLLYDDHNLYVAFEAKDKDIRERFSKRDDPIYEHEAVELFIMPNIVAPRIGPYVELQASPTGVIFDASFTGRRQGMDTKYNAGQTVATLRNGTLNDRSPDKGWVSEWKIPFAHLRWNPHPPKPGDEWRMNAFRIEKYQRGGKLAGEYTAWSPPGVGDFHAVHRFGRMRFLAP